MLWPHCLHGWIRYFSHGSRQCWRSWGMCDRRARLAPTAARLPLLSGPQDMGHRTTERLLQVWAVWQTAADSHPLTEQKMTTLGTAAALSNDQWKRSIFPFWRTLHRAMIASTLRVGECAAENMSCACQSRAIKKPAPSSPGPLVARLLLPSSGLVAKNVSRRQLNRLCKKISYFFLLFNHEVQFKKKSFKWLGWSGS